MALEIKSDGDRIDPEIMDLMMRFAEHRDLCEECVAAIKSMSGRYCVTGLAIFEELLKNPKVRFVPE